MTGGDIVWVRAPRLVAKSETLLATSDDSASKTLPIEWCYLNSEAGWRLRQLSLNYRFRATGTETESKLFDIHLQDKQKVGSGQKYSVSITFSSSQFTGLNYR